MSLIKGIIEFVMDILETVVFIGSLFIVSYLFIVAPNQVKGSSMEPTFTTGDYIITSKITYKFRSPQRGDVIVFKAPKNPDIDYIKRIIGLPKDKIVIQSGKVFVNDYLLGEPYISATTNLWDGGFVKDSVPVTVPDNEIFVMGDNRPRSSDSREFGPVPLDSIIGYVFFRYYPSNKAGTIKNPIPSSFRSSLTYLLSLRLPHRQVVN